LTVARREVQLSAAEGRRLEALRALRAGGVAGLPGLLAMRTDPSWAVRREVIAALAALGEPALESLWASLLSERDDETRIAATVDAMVASTGAVNDRIGAAGAELGAAVLADVAQVLGRRRDPASVPRLVELSRHADDNVAVAAIEGLGKIGGRAVVDALVEAVQSPSFFRTFAAIDVLGKSGDPRAIGPLAALLESPHYAFEAARALGRTCNRSAAAPLSALLTSPVDSLVRVAAVALADLTHRHADRFGTTAPIEGAMRRSIRKGATRRLMQCANGADTDEQVAINVVLGCLGDDAGAPTLVRSLDGPPEVAQAAAEALEKLSSDLDDQLVAALWEGDSARRQMLLKRMRDQRAIEAVIGCLEDADASVRRLACETLARIGGRSAVPHLFAALEDASQVVAQAATSAIISLGSDETPGLALAAAQSPNLLVRRAALRILSHIGSERALEVLRAAVLDENPRIREVAILGLSAFELPEARQLSIDLVGSASAPTRALALRALGDGGWRDAEVAALLAAALTDTDAWVRYYACQALGKLRLDAHVESLVARFEDAAGQVRVAAIEALSHMSGDTAFGALLTAARSDDRDLQRAALIGLGLSGRPEAASVLLANARSEDAATRLMALSALAHVDGQEVTATLSAAIRDSDESVRMTAIGLLGSRPGVEATLVLTRLLTDAALGERARAALFGPNQHRIAGLSAALATADDELALLITGMLARSSENDALAALFEAVTLPNAAARRAAATTLGALRSREALATLQRLSTEDPDDEMRRICWLLLTQ
jgi:HEAT repeat protein